MKKKNILSKVLFASIAVFSLMFSATSCKKKLTDTPLENMVTVADFSNGKQKSFFASDGWCNGSPFDVTWSKQNVSYDEGGAKLFISQGEDDKLYGGELRSSAHYWYGDYEITMKPEPKKGTCSSFFVYTGPSEVNENGEPNPHDEIDIEFLGKDTTHVQFNFFVDGKGGNEYKYDLGFDASKEYHTYGFRWTESYITWYVDGTPVYRVDETAKKPLPKTPGRMMMNYWSGTEEARLWMGEYEHESDTQGSYYKVVKTSADPITNGDPEAVINWDEIAPLSNLNVFADDKHTVTVDGSSYNVVYKDNVGATYTNVKFELEEEIKDKNYLHLKAKNNGSEPTSIRVDAYGEATRKTENNKYVTNVFALMDDVEAPTDLNWGGSSFNGIPAGEEVEIIIYYEGFVSSIQIMFETHIYGDTATHSGDVTISDIKFAKFGELKLPEENNNGGNSDVKSSIAINGVEKTFEGNLDTYTLTYGDNSLTAAYANLTGGSYQNINTQVNDIANSKNQVKFSLTNNGESTAKVRVDVDSNTQVNNTTACNTSATMDGNEVYTDTDWGGSTFEVAAKATVECIVNYDNSRNVKQLMFYIDSSTYQDTNVYTGSVTFTNISFEAVANDDDNNNNDNNDSSVALTFSTGGAYVINNDSANKSTNVTYENVMDSSYQCICANIADLVGDNTKVTLTFKNNGTEQVSFRLDVGYEKDGGLVSTIKSAINADFNSYDNTASFYLAAGEEKTVTVEFDTTTPVTGMNIFIDSGVWMDEGLRQNHSGNVTISNATFSK